MNAHTPKLEPEDDAAIDDMLADLRGDTPPKNDNARRIDQNAEGEDLG